MASSCTTSTDPGTPTNGKEVSPAGQLASFQGEYILTGAPEIPFEFPGGRALQILFVLLTQAGQYVSKTTLIREIWGDTPPPSSEQTLYSHITALRQCLGDKDKDRSAAEKLLQNKVPAGYRLRVDPQQVDALYFMGIVKCIKLYGGETEKELRIILTKLDHALPIVRGEALTDVRHGPILEGWIQKFNESHRRARALWVEAALELRRFREVVNFLMPHPFSPLDEDFARWCMLALYCTDRTAEALSLYRPLYAAMIEQFGVGPGPRTKALHDLILRERPEPLYEPQKFV